MQLLQVLCFVQAVDDRQAVALHIQLLKQLQVLYALQACELVVLAVEVCQQLGACDVADAAE
jgi:hypothetical protein